MPLAALLIQLILIASNQGGSKIKNPESPQSGKRGLAFGPVKKNSGATFTDLVKRSAQTKYGI